MNTIKMLADKKIIKNLPPEILEALLHIREI